MNSLDRTTDKTTTYSRARLVFVASLILIAIAEIVFLFLFTLLN